MKVLHGTAFYTGGGFYSVIGEFDNGLWFCGGNDWIDVIDADARTKNKVEDDLAFYYNNWLFKHEVKEYHEDKEKEREMYEAVEDFCIRLDNREEGLTDGYEEFSNYAAGEVTDMIDFSEFVGYVKQPREITIEEIKGTVNDALNDVFVYYQKILGIEYGDIDPCMDCEFNMEVERIAKLTKQILEMQMPNDEE